MLQRDGQGRTLQQGAYVSTNNPLAETLTWRADSTLNSYAATRAGAGAWNDSRTYQYNSRNQLTSEPMGVSSSVSATNNYGFDANKLGVLTSAQWSGGLTNRWQATSLNGLGQISQESWNQSGLTLRSSGSAGSATSVSATLDGSPVSGLVLGSGRWYADLVAEVAEEVLEERRDRVNPRVIKRKMSNWKKKRPEHRHYPQPTKKFRQSVVIKC